MKAEIAQGCLLGPVPYILYTSEISEIDQDTIATFGDDTSIMAVKEFTTALSNGE